MGNKNNTSKITSQIQKVFPYEINLIDVNYQQKVEGVQFTQSPYNIEQEKYNPKSFVDKQIRNSEFSNLSVPTLSNKSKPVIERYISKLKGFDKQFAQVNTTWRLTKYQQGGLFVAHCDRQKLLPDHKHFGTQLYLPPKSQYNYQGGQLVLKYDGKLIEILPHEQKWTHLILPLGIQHQVKKVIKGTRISFVKQIWVKQIEEPIQTDQDKQRRQEQQRRRRYDHRDRMVLD